jgi:CYTH domain-containing protein
LFIQGLKKLPIENERKVILQSDNPPLLLKSLKSNSKCETVDITQGYLNKNARIRHVIPHDFKKTEQHLFTYKAKVDGSVVEIETDITKDDYDKLFSIVNPVIRKTRVKCKNNNHCWDIDFFRTAQTGDIYLVMAEVEMPEFEFEIPEPLDIIAPYVVKWIEKDDRRFGSKNLHNATKVKELVKGFLNEKQL